MIELKKNLYPTDFSDFAAHAQSYVIELAKKFDAEVLLIHVTSGTIFPVAYSIGVDSGDIDLQIQKAAKKHLHKIEERVAAEGVKVSSELRVGEPFPEIIGVARREVVDLIIMATHGHGAVKHMFLGSTAEKVVRKAPCPVLTIRHPEHEFVHP